VIDVPGSKHQFPRTMGYLNAVSDFNYVTLKYVFKRRSAFMAMHATMASGLYCERTGPKASSGNVFNLLGEVDAA